MSERSGYIVKFKDFKGNERKAVATYSKQTNDLLKSKKFYVEFINDDFTPQLNQATGKRLIGCVSMDKCVNIGFID